ncbi:MAG: hypothetical protein DCC58_03100 [Chloroflexi bacterium]|nr:MAG: hypothetical protein DCC58_03100 [Chloroflexota bacterium]
MFSTPDDMALLFQMLLNGGELGGVRLLSPATVQAMTGNRLDDLPELPEPIRRTRPWGLGWRLNHRASDDTFGDLLGPRAYGHLGATGTMCWIDPDRDGFCLLLTTAPRDKAPWRLVHLSNAVAAAFRNA